MALDDLPGTLTVPTRDQIRDSYLRDYFLRNPGADISENTQPWIDASTFADQMTGVYALAIKAANNVLVRTSTGAQLGLLGAAENLPRRPAAGASGFVLATTSIGGGTLLAGDELRQISSGLRFTVTRTATYLTGDYVPITGLDTGASTNLAAGTALTFTSPRPGIAPTAIVAEQHDGAGLTGGGGAQSDAEYQDAIIAARATRPASGNAADYSDVAQKTPNVPVEAAFAFPAILGPGTMGVAFTVRSGAPGVSRRPSAAQIGVVESRLRATFPGDDMIFVATLLSDPVSVAFAVDWDAGASGWVDVVPWPAYRALSSAVIVDYALAPTAIVFRLKTADSNYSGTTSPVAGQTIAFYDAANEAFAQKRILSVSGAGPWTITCDATNNASDIRYVPIAGQRAMPFAASMTAIVPAVTAFFDAMGPGEQLASFFDPALRQKRFPPSPKTWPNVITNRLLAAVESRAEIADAVSLEGNGHVTLIGTPGVVSYLTELVDLAFFPLS